jgi:hypothetical protein
MAIEGSNVSKFGSENLRILIKKETHVWMNNFDLVKGTLIEWER